MDRSSIFLIDYRCTHRGDSPERQRIGSSPPVSKVKAYKKAKKSHGHASLKRQDRKGFAGKSKPMMVKVKGPTGGRELSRSKKGHK